MSMNPQSLAEQIPWSSFRAVLLDWAGTTIDYGSIAPVEVVRTVFAHREIEVTEAEAREPMGKAKIDHIKSVLAMPRIASQWRNRYGADATDNDISMIYTEFLQLQKEVLAKYSDPIPGVPSAVDFFRDQGCRIGSTTGYTRELMDVVVPLAAKGGYSPDVTICSDDVPQGRPAPWSNFRAAEALGVYPMSNVLVVDDSIAGIQAGKYSGCISIAISKTGNALGLAKKDVENLSIDELKLRLNAIEKSFYDVGADLVVESVGELASLWKSSI